MKYLALIFVLSLCGCNIPTGKGVYNGRLIDVSWQGWWMKSCELEFQLGQQSSKTSACSSRDQDYCTRMQKLLGTVVNVPYTDFTLRTVSVDSSYICGEPL